VPVVGARAGGLPEVVVDGECGFLHPGGDVEAMAESCRRILTEPGLREAMGRAGRERAIRLFSPESILPQYEAIYQEQIDRRKGC